MEDQRFKWKRITGAVERRILIVCESWKGTPYMTGQQARGIGVDCVQFIGAILDALYRRPARTLIPRLPPNAGLHSEESGLRTAMAIRKGFESAEVDDGSIEPGDVLVTRGTMDTRAHAYLGHVLLAGVLPGTAIHSTQGVGVSWTSVQGIPGILRIYRPLNKNTWA